MAVCIPMRPIPMNLYTKSAGFLTYADSGNLVAMGDDVTLSYDAGLEDEWDYVLDLYRGRVTGASYGEDGALAEIVITDEDGELNYFEIGKTEVAEG